jgi:hypothetical protein
MPRSPCNPLVIWPSTCNRSNQRVIPRSWVLAHSPLTGPAAWGRLPALLREQAYAVVVIDVEDDDEAPYAERYATRAATQIAAAEPPTPTIFVAHSGAGPLLPAITASLTSSGGYIFLDAGLPRPGRPSRRDLLREEDEGFAAEFVDSLRRGNRFPAWTADDLADLVPDVDDRIALMKSLRPRGLEFFSEPLPALEKWPDAPCGYLRTSAAYDLWLHIAEQRGWPAMSRDFGHFPALASPEGTLQALLELAARL